MPAKKQRPYPMSTEIEQSELQKLLMEAVNATLKAGKHVMNVYNSPDVQVYLKSDSTPLTEADRMAHEVIKASLVRTYIPVLSEEGRDIHYDERRNWEYFWIVDPLDGTKEFLKRNGEFTVNIALIHNNFPVIGVIYVPVSQVLYLSLPGLGAHRVQGIVPDAAARVAYADIAPRMERLPIAQPQRSELVVVQSRSHTSAETHAYIEQLRQRYGQVELLPVGSSLKMCMLAEGRADVYPRLSPSFEWDTAAGQAIVEGAGFKVCEHDSKRRLSYNKEDLQNPWFVIDDRG